MTKSLAVLVCLTSSLVFAQTVPGSISFNARLTDTAGTPVTGSHALSFGLYDQSSGGAALWNENASGVSFSTEGVAYAELGAITPLTASALDGRKLYLEVSVDGTTMAPRLAVVSVPYAIRASLAASALSVGSLNEAAIQKRVTGTCNAGQAVRSIDATGGVQCENVSGSAGISSIATPAGSGLSGGGTGAVTLGLATCANGEVLKSNGTSWACASVGGVTTGGGLTASASGTLSLQSCAAGETLRSNGTTWACGGASGGGGSGGPSIVGWSSTVGNWSLVSGQAATITLNTTDSLEGDAAFDFFVPSGTTGAVYTYGPQLPIDTRVPHVGRISARYQTGGGTFSAGIEAFGATGTSLGTRYFVASGIDLSTTGGGWQSYAGFIQGEGAGVNQFPVGTRFVRPSIIVSSNNIGLTRIDALALEPIVAIRRIARTTGYVSDQTDNGNLAGRAVSLLKISRSTGVRVAWSDNFRVIGTNTACRWELLFNGNPCTTPGLMVFDKYEGNQSPTSNRHDPASVFGTCFATSAGVIGPGTVNVSTRVLPVPGYPATDCYTGWASGYFSIEAEEVL